MFHHNRKSAVVAFARTSSDAAKYMTFELLDVLQHPKSSNRSPIPELPDSASETEMSNSSEHQGVVQQQRTRPSESRFGRKCKKWGDVGYKVGLCGVFAQDTGTVDVDTSGPVDYMEVDGVAFCPIRRSYAGSDSETTENKNSTKTNTSDPHIELRPHQRTLPKQSPAHERRKSARQPSQMLFRYVDSRPLAVRNPRLMSRTTYTPMVGIVGLGIFCEQSYKPCTIGKFVPAATVSITGKRECGTYNEALEANAQRQTELWLAESVDPTANHDSVSAECRLLMQMASEFPESIRSQAESKPCSNRSKLQNSEQYIQRTANGQETANRYDPLNQAHGTGELYERVLRKFCKSMTEVRRMETVICDRFQPLKLIQQSVQSSTQAAERCWRWPGNKSKRYTSVRLVVIRQPPLVDEAFRSRLLSAKFLITNGGYDRSYAMGIGEMPDSLTPRLYIVTQTAPTLVDARNAQLNLLKNAVDSYKIYKTEPR
ncbi:hypothetical protein CLF_105716 [Clonorchis sinensis]|uniref:Uncharacterized protein n=1 Tax=Clonorchis sinensis TaxID=79923 RepID=G7YE22_CLOSI|nr:hypothetical protein CLF_105716 [Clonorchis sinensis]